jgi:hypothetical protein
VFVKEGEDGVVMAACKEGEEKREEELCTMLKRENRQIPSVILRLGGHLLSGPRCVFDQFVSL